MDLMEDHSYLQYYNNDPYMQHANNSEHMSMVQHGGNNASHNSAHYLANKPPTVANGKQQPHLNASMNQSYSINHSSPIMTMIPPSQIPQIDQNTIQNNHQSRFCKNTMATSMNHYDPNSLSTYHQHQPSIQNHHSPSSNRTDLNHYNETVSLPHTAFNSQDNNNYGSSAAQPSGQPISKQHTINKNNLQNMVSNQQPFSMNCHATTDWNSSSSSSSAHMANTNQQRLKTDTNTNNSHNNCINYNITQDDICFSYLEQQKPEYSPMPSSSLRSPTNIPQESYLTKAENRMEVNKNDNNKNISKNSVPIEDGKKTVSTSPINLESFKTTPESTGKVAEKRHVIIFKIIEQYIDPETKCVIKEKITKNEEIIIPLGLTSQVVSNSSDNSAKSKLAEATNQLADSSSSLDVGSVCKPGKLELSPDSKSSFDKKPSSVDSSSSSDQSDDFEIKSNSDSNNNNVDVDHKNETENEDIERGAASALLSLQTANTPVKNFEIPATVQTPPVIRPTNLNDRFESNSATNPISQAQQQQPTLSIERLKPGSKIMAKWKDKNFYPAEIVKQSGAHKWMVRFEDMATRNLFENEIIRIEYLMVNQNIMVKISDELFKISKIKNIIKKDDGNREFDLEHIGDEDEKAKVTKRYTLKDMFLYAEQGTNILNKFSKINTIGAVFGDVDLDNIVSGKRARPMKSANSEDSNSNDNNSNDINMDDSKSKNKQVEENGRNNKFSANKKRKSQSTSNDDNVKLKKTSQKPKSSKNPVAKNSELRMVGHYYENSLALSPVPSKSIVCTIPKNELDKIFGPIPKPGSKLFQNMHFILTCGYSNNHKLFKSDDTNPECSTPFDKNYLVEQILNGNGHVHDSFDEMKTSNNGSECVCIADTYSRSIKFIQCLAAGVPIISHQWIIECCRQNQTLDRNSFILPAGYSIITRALSSEKNIFKKSSTLFKGIKFYFGSEQPETLNKLWAPVLFAAQAIVVAQDSNMHKSLQRGQVDIIIGDVTCPSALVTRAKQIKTPVVSSEYIVQCLINGRKLPYDASPLFSYAHRI